MSVILSFSPDTEQKLKERASRTGQSVEGFIEQLVEREVRSKDGGIPPKAVDETSPSGTELPSDKALAAFRREVRDSGMNDEELRAFFEEAREEVYRAKLSRPGHSP